MSIQEKEQLVNQIDSLLQKINQVEAKQVLKFVQSIVAEKKSQAVGSEPVIPLFTDEEAREMIRPKPKTGEEIVAAGLTGGWADEGIENGLDYIKAQRAKNRVNNTW